MCCSYMIHTDKIANVLIATMFITSTYYLLTNYNEKISRGPADNFHKPHARDIYFSAPSLDELYEPVIRRQGSLVNPP